MNPETLAQQFEAQDFDYYLNAMLDRVSDTIDKREGSIIYDALAPAANELAIQTVQLANVVRQSYVMTASGEFLDYRAAERGTTRQSATATQATAKFTDSTGQPVTSVHVGDQFASLGAEPVFYHVTAVNDDLSGILTADVTGTTPNSYRGQILPVTPNDSLSWAEITDVPVPARDAETDDHLRKRLLLPDSSIAYGGNVADYQDMLSKITDVGAGQIYPAWQGGGTVKLVILNNDLRAASAGLIHSVKEQIDPAEATSEGYGLAPIGHNVTVVAPTELAINVASTIEVDSQITIAAVQAQIEAGISDYFKQRRMDWNNVDRITGRGYKLTIYRAQLLTAILKVDGVVNASLPRLNGTDGDVTLVFNNSVSQLPVLGTVTLNG
ncbi:baseplate J/gp47 family protein [Lactiplantibacillus sp. WILCCON 0030]|uniref:Baseplate J/gp47 family protein n=1 Tax=Lactiplantibacillus brownii TaxID=3069269 RepID=A0ABU1A8A5_9LACO|nr:baseplate J/gp47 family protein [Lactiplantibacillus brownii]MDQ7937111.1 baseplate J/gp47 family protein [Lactiplantibacillus brownii]